MDILSKFKRKKEPSNINYNELSNEEKEEYIKNIFSMGLDLIKQYIEVLRNEKSKYIYVEREYMPYDFDSIIGYLENNLKNVKIKDASMQL